MSYVLNLAYYNTMGITRQKVPWRIFLEICRTIINIFTTAAVAAARSTSSDGLFVYFSTTSIIYNSCCTTCTLYIYADTGARYQARI